MLLRSLALFAGLLLAVAPARAGEGALVDLVPAASEGKLHSGERAVLEAVPDDDPAAPAAAALLLANAESRGDLDARCSAAEVLVRIAPPAWRADAHLEMARCLLLRDDPAAAAGALQAARSEPDGFRSPEHALLAADLHARSLTLQFSDGLAAGNHDAATLTAAIAAWDAVASQADALKDVLVRNRANRLKGDLKGYDTHRERGYSYAATQTRDVGSGVGSLLDLVAETDATLAASTPDDQPAESAVEGLDALGPRGFRELDWGVSPSKVKQSEKSKPEIDEPDRLVYRDRLLGKSCGVVFRFRRERLVEGAYVITEGYRRADDAREGFEELEALLEQKYGESGDIDEVVWKGPEGSSSLRGLSEGEASFQARWTFERTVISVVLDNDRARYRLRVVYEAKSSTRPEVDDTEKERERALDKL
ncbi:MAG: hypothetical protein GY898_17085 [Proteobacteria bacterium]|nr:hypothetical protein [Pseudomonadota bacterium]